MGISCSRCWDSNSSLWFTIPSILIFAIHFVQIFSNKHNITNSAFSVGYNATTHISTEQWWFENVHKCVHRAVASFSKRGEPLSGKGGGGKVKLSQEQKGGGEGGEKPLGPPWLVATVLVHLTQFVRSAYIECTTISQKRAVVNN